MNEIIWQQDTLGAEFKVNEVSDEHKQKAEEFKKKLEAAGAKVELK